VEFVDQRPRLIGARRLVNGQLPMNASGLLVGHLQICKLVAGILGKIGKRVVGTVNGHSLLLFVGQAKFPQEKLLTNHDTGSETAARTHSGHKASFVLRYSP
tara:strand:- start:106 stop:411 length:306 start_codon:yes stop_codon:yes gene_type:complete